MKLNKDELELQDIIVAKLRKQQKLDIKNNKKFYANKNKKENRKKLAGISN